MVRYLCYKRLEAYRGGFSLRHLPQVPFCTDREGTSVGFSVIMAEAPLWSTYTSSVSLWVLSTGPHDSGDFLTCSKPPRTIRETPVRLKTVPVSQGIASRQQR
jgi:hypothetical protein